MENGDNFFHGAISEDHPGIESGTLLLQKSFSMAFRDNFTVSFALEKDLMKLSIAPKWDRGNSRGPYANAVDLRRHLRNF